MWISCVVDRAISKMGTLLWRRGFKKLLNFPVKTRLKWTHSRNLTTTRKPRSIQEIKDDYKKEKQQIFGNIFKMF